MTIEQWADAMREYVYGVEFTDDDDIVRTEEHEHEMEKCDG